MEISLIKRESGHNIIFPKETEESLSASLKRASKQTEADVRSVHGRWFEVLFRIEPWFLIRFSAVVYAQVLCLPIQKSGWGEEILYIQVKMRSE